MERLALPPSRACSICRLRLSEDCVTSCAPEGKYKLFEPDMRRRLIDLPKLTFEEYQALPGPMKGNWLFIVETKIMEALNGEEVELPMKDIRLGRIVPNGRDTNSENGS